MIVIGYFNIHLIKNLSTNWMLHLTLLFLLLVFLFSFCREPPKKILKFRNYAPKDEKLKEKKVDKVKPIDGK